MMLTLKKICSVLGVVDQIHYKNHDFSSVEVCIFMDLSNPKHQFHNTIIIQDIMQKYNILVKNLKLKEIDESSQDPLVFTPEDEVRRCPIEHRDEVQGKEVRIDEGESHSGGDRH